MQGPAGWLTRPWLTSVDWPLPSFSYNTSHNPLRIASAHRSARMDAHVCPPRTPAGAAIRPRAFLRLFHSFYFKCQHCTAAQAAVHARSFAFGPVAVKRSPAPTAALKRCSVQNGACVRTVAASLCPGSRTAACSCCGGGGHTRSPRPQTQHPVTPRAPHPLFVGPHQTSTAACS